MAGGEGALAGSVVGAYQVGELIGVGPLAEVYQAQRPGLSWPVALKVFAPSVAANTDYMGAMRDIAARASQLNSGHILPIQGFEREGALLFLSMPLMRESLRAALRRAGALPLYRAVPLLRQIAYGLAAAHSANIIHRDLKPENVLLDAEGRAYVSDFGIGRDLPQEEAERRSLGTLSSLIGAPAYMAPEQLRGQPADQRADVYALGVIFYEMLTGVTPYSGATVYEVAAQALTKPIPPPTRRGAGITPLVERALLQALAREPAERWPTVQRFIVGLNAALPVRPDTPAEPDGAPSRLRYGLTTNPLPPANDAATAATDLTNATDATDVDGVPQEAPTPMESSEWSQLANAPALDADERSQSSGAIAVPDLRLFRVDPLPPPAPRTGLARIALIGVALLALGVLIVGGAILANAARLSSNPEATPTAPPATLAPTEFVSGPAIAPLPTATAKPTTPPPRPTATHKPAPTATPTTPEPTPSTSTTP